MKSLVEEASSIAKAIEKAWERAGKPQSFSVKVYEAAEKNFFGFVKKSAKVGIFFEEEVAHKGYDRNQNRSTPHQKPYNRNESSTERTPRHNGRDNRVEGREEDRRPRHNGSSTHRTEQPVQQQQRHSDTERPEVKKNNFRPDRNERSERSDRNDRDASSNRPHNGNNRRSGQNQDRPQRTNESRPNIDESYKQPLVSNVQFDQSEPIQAAPIQQQYVQPQQTEQRTFVAPVAAAQAPQHTAQEPIATQQPQQPVIAPVAPAIQPQRKVLKVSGRMYTRPKNDGSDNSGNK